ncbi:YaiI/YqxD family protein [Hirschia maritima]|uniref:YaiI/YqxD family protein n=1 Tax=Hirschia maritima TaxID=1121961 RepID=UPI00037ECA08|nr:YaiI/YqxD family protein [Hirschia maritima]
MASNLTIYIDADACPVKNETYKVAERHTALTWVVSNSFLQVPRMPFIKQMVVDAGPDEADNWIAENCDHHSVVITADILLAERALENDAIVLKPDGKAFTKETIGAAVATRALMEQLRSTGEQMGGAAPFSQADRSRFLQALHEACVKLKSN